MKTLKNKTFGTTMILALAALELSACSGVETEAKYPSGKARESASKGSDIYGDDPGIFGNDGGIFGSKKKKSGSGDSGIGVNSFLWRATIDTVSFMPLASADPFGGVILTDWYSDPDSPKERIKINAFIMGRELKADGIRVRTFRQELRGNTWRDAAVSEDTARKLEDTILTRARQLRISHLADEK